LKTYAFVSSQLQACCSLRLAAIALFFRTKKLVWQPGFLHQVWFSCTCAPDLADEKKEFQPISDFSTF
jgi:hypothetical protein